MPVFSGAPGDDYRDVVGRATQDAKAEGQDEGIKNQAIVVSHPANSLYPKESTVKPTPRSRPVPVGCQTTSSG